MYSLRTKILTVILGFMVFFGVAFVLYSVATTANYKRLRLQIIEGTVAFETEKVNKTIGELERGAVSMARAGLLFYDFRVLELGEIAILEYLRGFPVAMGAGFWFEPYAHDRDTLHAGIYAFFDKEKDEVRLDDTFVMEDYDYHRLNWYREIFDAVKAPYQTVWTKPYVDDTGSYSFMTTAGAGIYDEHGKLIGISTVDWEIEGVIEELSTIKLTENSFVVLCAPGQDYIISSTHDKSVAGSSISAHLWDINASSIALDGVTYMQFHRFMNNGWLLAVQIPEDEIFADIETRNRNFSIIIAFASAMMLYLAYVFISSRINAPIKRLITDVSQLDLDNLDICVEDSSNDELGLLGRTFNKMVTELRESIDAYTWEHAEKEKIGADLRIAADIQVKMLPNIFPAFPDLDEFDIHASMFPAKEVGGDLYDFYLIDKENLAVVIADVSGKGVPAALFMVIAKTLIKNYVFNSDYGNGRKTPGEVFRMVNNLLCENNDSQMFATAFLGYYNLSTGKFVYVNAAHNPPMVRKGANNYELLETKSSLVLGFMKNAIYPEEEITLEPGDALYLYTDGVTEAMNAEEDLFSESRLLEALEKYRDCEPKELLAAIKQEIDNFADGTEQADDITMLALKINKRLNIKEMIIETGIKNLNAIMTFINTELEAHKCPEDFVDDIDTAVEEIFVNITNYAYGPDGGNVTCSITYGNAADTSAGEEAVIQFEDSGKPYNPLEHPDPDLDKPLMERDVGGLGIFLAKQIMDKLEYTRAGNKNILVMRKKMP